MDSISPLGAWKLHFASGGIYRITLRSLPEEAPAAEARLKTGSADLILGRQTHTKPIAEGAREVEFELHIPRGTVTLETVIKYADKKRPDHGAFYVTIELIDTL